MNIFKCCPRCGQELTVKELKAGAAYCNDCARAMAISNQRELLERQIDKANKEIK